MRQVYDDQVLVAFAKRSSEHWRGGLHFAAWQKRRCRVARYTEARYTEAAALTGFRRRCAVCIAEACKVRSRVPSCGCQGGLALFGRGVCHERTAQVVLTHRHCLTAHSIACAAVPTPGS